MRGKGADRASDHRHAADRAILLWAAALDSSPAAGSYDQRSYAHRSALILGVSSRAACGTRMERMLQCGKTGVALAQIPPYFAQLYIIGANCIKFVHTAGSDHI